MDLLRSRRFLPFFIVQFLGAFSDNVFKNAFIILATFSLAKESGWNVTTVVNLIIVLFLFPSIFLSAIGGQLADKFNKSKVLVWTKLAEVGIMGVAAVGFATGSLGLLMVATLLVGAQLAVFGPLKYGILPNLLRREELVQGSSLVEASTFIAILLGTILGGLSLTEQQSTSSWLPWTLLVLSVVGWLISKKVPPTTASDKSLEISWDVVGITYELILKARPQVKIWRSILGLSWFWMVGSIWLAFLPTYVATHLKTNDLTLTIFIAIFTLGVGVGAIGCQRLLKGEISAKYVPLAGLALSFLTLLFLAAQSLPHDSFNFLSPHGLITCGCLFWVAVSCGIFSVPLYTILQAYSDPAHTSRNIAANNVLNGIFIVAGNGLVAALGYVGLSDYIILGFVALANIGVSIYVVKLIPESVIHTFVRGLLRLAFQVKIEGLENYKKARERKVIIANHISYLDAALLTAFLPEIPTFAINTTVSQQWWIRPILKVVRAYPIDPSNPMAIKSLTKLVKGGTPVAIFPEGRLTVTGRLMKIYEGPGVMSLHADADIIPIQLSGVEFTRFAYLKNKVKQRWLPKITITILPPIDLTCRREKEPNRDELRDYLYTLMNEMAFSSGAKVELLFDALIRARNTHGAKTKIIDDPSWKPLSYASLVAKSLVLGPKLAQGTKTDAVIGILLPNSKAAIVTLFGLQSQCRCVALLNFSLGSKNLVSTCKTAQVQKIWTSEKFIKEGKLEREISALEAEGFEISYLEKIKPKANDKFKYFLGLIAPQILWQKTKEEFMKGCGLTCSQAAQKPAVILFTSGSSGTSKAVVLSHSNLISNVHQLLCVTDLNRSDKVFNALPIFHSFGLTGGTLAPLFGGVFVFMYPSPLHYRIIPEMVYQSDATILFGTNTFLNGYSKKAHPYDFYSLRYVFAGAEKVRQETKNLWSEVFGVRILEGYGTTECSPALSMNTPMFNRSGTVGKFLPKISYRLEPIEGVDVGGRLWVKGPNVMLGYILPEAPGVLQPPEDGWYDTGDIVEVSADGFVKILGRAKRFAKVGGEMISLTSVEELASLVYPSEASAALSIPHPTRGEEIVLFTEHPNPSRAELLEKAKALEISELCVPKNIIEAKIPVLGSGKPDYVSLKQMLPEGTNP